MIQLFLDSILETPSVATRWAIRGFSFAFDIAFIFIFVYQFIV